MKVTKQREGMEGGEGKAKDRNARTSRVRLILLALIVEKAIQHAVVTVALGVDFGGIRSTVAINPDRLMVTGAAVGALFALGLWGMVTRRGWAANLVIALALFDVVGEFIAQGRVDIVITVSFVVATVLLVVALRYRRQEQEHALA